MSRPTTQPKFQRWLALPLIIVHLILLISGFAQVSSAGANPSPLAAKLMGRSALPPHPHDPSYKGQRPLKSNKASVSAASNSNEEIASIKHLIGKTALSANSVDSEPTDPKLTSADSDEGEDLMIYLYPKDGRFDSDSDSENFEVYIQHLPNPFTGYDESQDSPRLNANVYAHYTRPAAFSSGSKTLILYVGADYNIYAVYADNTEHKQFTTSGEYCSVALTPDGRYLAYTTTNSSDNNIYVYDFNTDTVMPYEIIPSADQDSGDSTGFNTIIYAYALAFDYTGKKIVFDASCADGNGNIYWSIGILDLSDGSVFFPFPKQSPELDVAYPSFAVNNNFIIAMDVIDKYPESTSGSIASAVCTYNLIDKTLQIVDEPNFGSANRAVFGIPSFWGDDNYITVQRRSDTNSWAIRVPIDANWAGNPAAAEQLNDYDLTMPIMHRIRLSAELVPNTYKLDFGNIAAGSSKSLDLTLTNNGNRDIEVRDIHTSNDSFTHNGSNTLLPAGSEMTITVSYHAAASPGRQEANLEIISDADTPTLSISLTGQSSTNGNDGGNNGGSGGGSAGGCFIHNLIGALGTF